MSVWLSFGVSESDVNIANNTSVVTINVYANWNRYHWNGYNQPGTIYIDGTAYGFAHPFNTGQSTSGSCWIGVASKTIAHNSDGSKSISYSASYDTGTSQGTVSNSGSVALTTIPRVSDISCNKQSIDANGSTTMTVTTTKKSSSFTDVIKFKLGSREMTITSGTAFSIPLAWCDQMPSATSLVGYAEVETFKGSTSLGTNTVNVTVNVPSSVVPTISTVSATETVSAVTTAFGNRVVQNLSKLLLNATASGAQGSTIAAYSFTVDGVTYGSNGVTTNALNSSGTLVLTTVVTDTRGRTATNTKNITVVAYTSPSVHATFSISGTTLALKMDGAVSSVSSQNTKAIQIKYKKMSDASYTTVSHTPSNWSFSDTKNITIDPTAKYEFIVRLTDKISYVEDMFRTGLPAISFYAGGDGVTFGDEASTNGAVFKDGWDIKIEDGTLQASLVAVFGNSILA